MEYSVSYYTMKRKILLNFINAGIQLINVIVLSSLMKFFTDVIGMSPAIYGIVFVIFSIWNGINDPMVGYWADRRPFDSKKGKYLHLMRWSIPIMALTIIPLFFASPTWPEITTAIYLLVLLVIYEAARTMLEVSFNAFKINAFISMKERSEVQVIGSYVAMLPVLIGSMIPAMFLTGEFSRLTVAIIFSGAIAIGLILVLIGSKFIKEDPHFYENMQITKGLKELFSLFFELAKDKVFLYFVAGFFLVQAATGNYYAGFLYYMDNVILAEGLEVVIPDILTGVGQMAIFPLIIISVKKFGAKYTFIAGSMLAVIGHFTLTFNINYWVASGAYIVILMGYGFNGVIMKPMEGLVVDHIELKTGKRQPGVIAGIMAVFLIPAMSVQTIIMSTLMSASGYVGSVKEQSAEVVQAIRYGTGIIPGLILLTGLIVLSRLPLNKTREHEIQKAIEEKHASHANNLNDDCI